MLEIRETYAEIDSPRLGFVADFSSTMHSMSPTILRKLGKMGLGAEELDRLQEIWATDADINARHGEFVEYLHSRGIAPESLGSFARLAFNMHGHVDPAEWADIMPLIVHVHAKFYDIDEHGDEPAIDYPAIVREFVDGGYSGFFSSEWEGHAFADLDEADPVDLVRKQHDLIRRSITAALRQGLLTCTSSPPTSNCSSPRPARRRRPGPRRRGRGLRRRRDVVLDRQGPRLAGQGARRHRRAADLAARRARG